MGGDEVAVPTENTLAVATALADASRVDPGHGDATHQCHASVRGDGIPIAQLSGSMGVRLGSQMGTRTKALYTAQYGAVAGDNIPKRTTRYEGKLSTENVYFSQDRGLMKQTIREVTQA